MASPQVLKFLLLLAPMFLAYGYITYIAVRLPLPVSSLCVLKVL